MPTKRRETKMKLYHGTNTEFNSIDLSKSQHGKDFGKGFYLSSEKHQAEKLAIFKALQLGGDAIVQTYEIDDSFMNDNSLKILYFDGYSKEWAEFILRNRNNMSDINIHNYDIVYGPIANDKVGIQIRNFLEHNIDFDTFVNRIKFLKGITFQYYFGSQKAIEMLTRVYE